jgi:putative toxin-antitoxin system antitoxin component (TIGR02293 family)
MATAFSFDSLLLGPSLSRVRQIEDGLPASAVRGLIDGKAVTLSDLVGIVATRRTLDRRLADDAPLTAEEGDRFARFAEVLALAVHVFGDRESAMAWLRAPKRRLDGAVPLHLMRTHTGTELVTNLLNQGRHGMLA